MATTTASITIASDIIPTMPTSYYKTATLNKAATCTGLENLQSGTVEYISTSTVALLDQSALTTQLGTIADKANRVYIKNLSTIAEEYIEVAINSVVLGRLYAGDWMFIPWGAEDSAADVQVTPSVATSMKINYVLLHE